MKKALKLFGIVTFAAVIGFTMAACDNGIDPILPAPSGLTATVTSSTVIQISWNRVDGASGYHLYASLSSSSGFALADTTSSTSSTARNGTPNTAYYFKVAAYDAAGTEGDMSNVVSATTFPSANLTGVWNDSDGTMQITVTGSIGVYTRLGSGALALDAASKGYIRVGDQAWRNITSTGTYTWSGQMLGISYNTSSPNVATGTGWRDCTFTISQDGTTLSSYTPGFDTPSSTWIRGSSLSINGVWESSGGIRILVSGSTGIITNVSSSNLLWTNALNNNHIQIGGEKWRNLTSTGALTWSGQDLAVTYSSSSPNVATGTQWGNGTFTMSSNGQTITVNSVVWTRRTQ